MRGRLNLFAPPSPVYWQRPASPWRCPDVARPARARRRGGPTKLTESADRPGLTFTHCRQPAQVPGEDPGHHRPWPRQRAPAASTSRTSIWQSWGRGLHTANGDRVRHPPSLRQITRSRSRPSVARAAAAMPPEGRLEFGKTLVKGPDLLQPGLALALPGPSGTEPRPAPSRYCRRRYLDPAAAGFNLGTQCGRTDEAKTQTQLRERDGGPRAVAAVAGSTAAAVAVSPGARGLGGPQGRSGRSDGRDLARGLVAARRGPASPAHQPPTTATIRGGLGGREDAEGAACDNRRRGAGEIESPSKPPWRLSTNTC